MTFNFVIVSLSQFCPEIHEIIQKTTDASFKQHYAMKKQQHKCRHEKFTSAKEFILLFLMVPPFDKNLQKVQTMSPDVGGLNS